MNVRGFFKEWSFATSAVIVFALVVANHFILLPYFIFSPGSVRGVSQYLEVPPEQAHPDKGDVLLTTVALRRARPSDMVWAWVTPNTRIEKQDEILGDRSQEDYLKLAEQAMDDSKQQAIAVAMRRAGYEATFTGKGAQVREVLPESPADGNLSQGDVITEIDGKPVQVGSDVTTYVRGLKPGQQVELEVTGVDGKSREVTVTPVARPDGSEGVLMGVLISTYKPDLETPFPVDVKETDIGGPSAGLAFSLALLNMLTPGDITGGADVAATGTITADGKVGRVGGLEQKIAAANDSDASIFLVPNEELEEAKRYADDDLKVVGVESLNDAVQALAESGGDLSGVSTPSPVPAAA